MSLHNHPFRISLKRGLAAALRATATLAQAIAGEPYWATDTARLYACSGIDGDAGQRMVLIGGEVGVETITADTTADADSDVVLLDASGGNVTLTLPSAADARSRPLVAKRTDSSGNTVTIAAAGSDTIDGAASATLASQWASVVLLPDGGTGWVILAKM